MPNRTHPLIGLTTYGRSKDNRYSLPVEYLDAVRRAGGIPVLIASGELHWESLLERLDAFILTDGSDIDSARYGGRSHETLYGSDIERDALELAIARKLIDSRLPMLGICRGTQILNAAQGGSLIEHIPDELGDAILHRTPSCEPVPHAVQINPQSRLARILGENEFDAASWHHQSPRRIGAGFEIVAIAPDGVIEALEKPDHPWLFAVQWHPELTAASDPLHQRLFDSIVAAAHSERG